MRGQRKRLSFLEQLILSGSLLGAVFLLASCGNFNPVSDRLDSTSDGSFVIESQLKDEELLDYGLVPIYRFHSSPGLIAVKQVSNSRLGVHSNEFNAANVSFLISENKRQRVTFASRLETTQRQPIACNAAFCEAGFDKVLQLFKEKKIKINPIHVGVIDSGVLPATLAIQTQLLSSQNITEQNDPTKWLSHATMISSLFAGVSTSKNSVAQNVYAPNASIDSIKIAFKDEGDQSNREKYGSMQLAVAMDKAITSGDRIVNLSLTYESKLDENIAFAEQALMAVGAKKGVIFVAAAGNGGVNLEGNSVYPASYDANNLVVVGSHNWDLRRAVSSNYGKAVDVSAQGATIAVNDKFGQLSYVGGTSFAAPLVVSALALSMGYQGHQNSEVSHILQEFFSSANPIQKDAEVSSRYGHIDVQKLFEHILSESH